MKFIVFNIVVAGALIYLVSTQNNGTEVPLPDLGVVTAAAEQALDRAAPPVRQAGVPVDAPTIADADLVTSGPESEIKVAVAEPVPVPVPVPVIEVPTRQTHVAPTPAPIDKAPGSPIALRRAEVLGVGPMSTPAPPAPGRRQQLLELAEEMEFLAAEFSVQ